MSEPLSKYERSQLPQDGEAMREWAKHSSKNQLGMLLWRYEVTVANLESSLHLADALIKTQANSLADWEHEQAEWQKTAKLLFSANTATVPRKAPRRKSCCVLSRIPR